MNPTPTLDPAYLIGWHVGKAASDRAVAAEVRVPAPRVSVERIEARQ